MLVLPQFVAFAVGAPLAVIVAASFVSGFGIAVHVALWFTVFQTEVPDHARSRVSSYDAFGSFVLNRVGAVIAGSLAAAFGVSAALWVAAAVIVATSAAMLSMRTVWAIRAP